MQSAVPHVLQVLERTHDPARVPQAVAWARAAGFEQVSLDLIYGTPGETVADWQASVDAALACEPDHVSAYSLIVEEGTRLARQVRTGVIPAPDDDDLAEKYVIADDAFTAAGLHWYEVSNWARDEAARCRHNELYWRSNDWWGVGPGAHSHVAGERWWNVKHPSAYAARIAAGESPAQDGEVLEDEVAAPGAGAARDPAARRAPSRAGRPGTRRGRRTPRAGRARAGPSRAHPEGPPPRRRGGPRPRRLRGLQVSPATRGILTFYGEASPENIRDCPNTTPGMSGPSTSVDNTPTVNLH